MRSCWAWTIAAMICGDSASARAESGRQAVPPPLAPWVSWVLDEVPDYGCAFAGARALCSWAGELELELGPEGGRFAQRVWADRALRFALPGASARWPLAVRVDGDKVPVLERDGEPGVELAAGEHRLEGAFAWNALPERLELPAQTALIELRVDGQRVPFPRRDEQGQLWLAGGAAASDQGEQLALSVSRKIEDGVPLIVTTRIELRVSGRARELSLGRVLLADTAPLSIESELPARLEADGSLRLSAHAGTFRTTVRARSTRSPERLAYQRAGPAWPESEVWVWQADEALRQVELSGAPAIDPARTELAADWRSLPAFLLRAGDALRFKTLRRGEPAPPPNRLSLTRELWLDLDGRGYTVRDVIEAELRQHFRLDLLAGELGHVAADGEDLLITKASDGKRAGVELRRAKQRLVAEWRARAARDSPAVGWSEDVQSLATTLHVGPGWRLFAARGADGVSDTWLAQWDLFDFFYVLLVALAVARLAGRGAGLGALFALVLCQGEPGAPGALFFALLSAIALLRVLPAGAFRNLVRLAFALSAGALLLISVPFAIDQVRAALYPQLGTGGWLDAPAQVALAPLSSRAPEPAVAAEYQAIEEIRAEGKVALGDTFERGMAGGMVGGAVSAGQSADSAAPSKRALQQDPEATVQTGPGVPDFRWRSWRLTWSGPVAKDHRLQLYLIPPAVERALCLLRVGLLFALIAALLRCATPGGERPSASSRGPSSRGGPSEQRADRAASTGRPPPAGTFLLALLSALSATSAARAELPERALLEQLKARLTKPAACRPSCVAIDELSIEVSERELALIANVHAGERTSLRLPGPAASWVPAEIELDRRPGAPAILLDDGFLHVRVEAGVHTVVARGPLPPGDVLTLALAERPRRARVSARGFEVGGVREDGRVEETLELRRSLRSERGAPLESASLPAWFLLERELELGTRWQLRTRVTRVSPAGTPVMLRVPLLPGESVTDAALEPDGPELALAFGRDQTHAEWTSRLRVSERIELVASQGRPWSERWKVSCGPIWRCQLQGLTPIHHLADQRWQPELAPFPGERASVRVSRPEPAAGQSVTIDRVDFDVTPGVRLLKASLRLQVRASRGASQRVSLPASARVQQLSIDGRERPIRVERGQLAFTLEPGSHAVSLQWQEPAGGSVLARAPRVELQRAATNLRVSVHVPEDRWLLWVRGPSWGPAILFWGYLLLALAAAYLLARAPHAPLGARQWMLLGLGLTQVPAPAALCVVAWFFALSYRERMPERRRWLHNLTQLLLLAFTSLALGCLYAAVQAGLLMRPDMQVAGAGSSASDLEWYLDRSSGALPTPSVISAPLWLFRVLMLLWSLWLAASLLRWLPWAFGCFRQGGLWKKKK